MMLSSNRSMNLHSTGERHYTRVSLLRRSVGTVVEK